jgi:hypothetical protein
LGSTRLNTIEELSVPFPLLCEDDEVDRKVGVAVVGTGFVTGQADLSAFNKIPRSGLVAL